MGGRPSGRETVYAHVCSPPLDSRGRRPGFRVSGRGFNEQDARLERGLLLAFGESIPLGLPNQAENVEGW